MAKIIENVEKARERQGQYGFKPTGSTTTALIKTHTYTHTHTQTHTYTQTDVSIMLDKK